VCRAVNRCSTYSLIVCRAVNRCSTYSLIVCRAVNILKKLIMTDFCRNTEMACATSSKVR